MNPAERKFKNTFAPWVKNKELSIDGIIGLMQRCQFPFSQLPPEVQKAVREELDWRRIQESLR